MKKPLDDVVHILDGQKANNKGITLIALIITIIVMLILAGITISIVIDRRSI